MASTECRICRRRRLRIRLLPNHVDSISPFL